MNFDKGIITSILDGGKEAFRAAEARGLHVDYLDGENADVYRYISDYLGKYGQVPSPEIVTSDTGVTLERVEGPQRYFEDQLQHRALTRELSRFGTEFVNHLQQKDGLGGFALMEQTIRDLRAQALVSSRVETLFSLAPLVKERYLRMKAGERGILTRWPTVNRATLGFWPHETHLFTARTGVGKTWTSIVITLDAWQGVTQAQAAVPDQFDPQGNIIPYKPKKHKVLYVTTEMSQETIAQRFFAVKQGVDYQRARGGNLTAFQEQAYLNMLDQIKSEDGIYIVGGGFDYTVGGLCAAIEECEPHLVVFDGAYLLKGDGKSRHEKAADAFNNLKRALMKYPVSAVVTNQLNRDAKKDEKKSMTTATIATTDVAGWNADTAIALFQSDDMKEQKRMIYVFMKAREAFAREMELNWDLETMDFSELMASTTAGAAGGSSSGDMADIPENISEDEVPF